MKGLDTNVLVRMLVRDDPVQTEAAERALAKQCTAEDPCRIDRVVMAELAWVLRSAYGYARADIARALERVALTAEFVLDDADEVWAAVVAYRTGRADFSDCLVAHSNAANGCDATLTFDRGAATLPQFVLIADGISNQL